MNNNIEKSLSKVPQVTVMFWIIKIFATTVGETGGDALSMSLQLGYGISSLIFIGFFFACLFAQIKTKRYYAFVYWFLVIATTTVGTTMSDYFDRSLGMGYIKSSSILFLCVIGVLISWHFIAGRIEFQRISTRKDEVFYWLTILISNTLGTALGDFTATDLGCGFQWGALVFLGMLALIGLAFFLTKIPKSILFWSAYVLTRPLGATLGDTITKPITEGGFNLGRITSSVVIAALMFAFVVIRYRKSGLVPSLVRVKKD